MSWLQAQLTVSKEQSPLMEMLLENMGALSVTLIDAADEPMLEPAPGETPLWSNVVITGLFSNDTNPDQLRATLHKALNQDVLGQLQLNVLEDKVWERVWLDNFHPIQFGQRLWICPTGKQVTAKNSVVVSLDPGLAFGTGTHPTTALCLEWLDNTDLKGKTLIDYGCGSGVLAIAALKLGAEKVIAVDHDPQAILATQANAERNQVADRLVAQSSEAFTPVQADIVIANILANILVQLSDKIIPLLHPEGRLILSGILQNQVTDVASAYDKVVRFETPVHRSEWIRLDGQRH